MGATASRCATLAVADFGDRDVAAGLEINETCMVFTRNNHIEGANGREARHIIRQYNGERSFNEPKCPGRLFSCQQRRWA